MKVVKGAMTIMNGDKVENLYRMKGNIVVGE